MYKKGLYAIAALVGIFLLGLIGYIIILFLGNYVIDEKKIVMDSATRLVDENGNELTKLYVKNRDLVSIDKIPKHVQQAFISIEDVRFYEHHGIDFKSIGRALYRDILAGGSVEGGSTLTQQLAKNVFLSNDKTLLRKTKEVVVAINLEQRYSKQKLLEMYLNQIYFGHGAYGIQAASKLYFNKDVSELTVEEGALLAALPKAPNSYSPILHPEKSIERRNVVLNAMQKAGYLSAEKNVRLQGRTLGLNVKEQAKNPAYLTYIDMVIQEAEKKYSISSNELLRGGYTVKVPMSTKVQEAAYELMKENRYFPGADNSAQGAFVLVDNKSGGVLSVMGGRDYVQKSLNRVNVKRQPGSTMKPIAVYGPALEEGQFKPYSLLQDKLRSYGRYTPKNVDGQYAKKVTMYDALKDSKNAAAVWTLNQLGVETSKQYLTKLGIPLEDKGLAIALGGLKEGITPLQLAGAYRAFAENGENIQPYFIQEIKDQDGKVIAKAVPDTHKAFSKQTAWYMTKMLQGVVKEGTAKNGEFKGELAGKTGSTSYTNVKGATRDAWFVGYTPDVVGSVWMGYDSTNDQHYLTKGSSYPTLLFKDILTRADYDEAAFQKPAGVKDLTKPIRLEQVKDLKQELTFHPFGLLTVNLSWTPSPDKRAVYYVYEKKGDKAEVIGKVKGKGAFEKERVNLLDSPTYYVVPYNSQTKQKGKKSNEVTPALFQ
ncbi:transglycosylase domain-containing protein [Priestia megaterium]|uniref:transglycosylase domain-containing protein n=1 Tax=Priestia megaterium TaxID=1404 RepID=UPI00245354CE|nr:PBP1A family penicillin-binding protein [Priestia megaterium]MDH3144141.1 PBP1A family penicillin-binding protein [Priestia megaterium]